MMRPIIIKNRIKCNYCGDIIESTSRHDMRWCSCGRVAVDGGHDYQRRSFTSGSNDYMEMSIVKDVYEDEELSDDVGNNDINP